MKKERYQSAIRPNKNFGNERMQVQPKASPPPPRLNIKETPLEKWFQYQPNQNKDEDNDI